jgi:hypothetical protein
LREKPEPLVLSCATHGLGGHGAFGVPSGAARHRRSAIACLAYSDHTPGLWAQRMGSRHPHPAQYRMPNRAGIGLGRYIAAVLAGVRIAEAPVEAPVEAEVAVAVAVVAQAPVEVESHIEVDIAAAQVSGRLGTGS